MGDWIMFRGRRRFVIRVRPAGLLLERVRENRYPSRCVFYSVSAHERATIRVVDPSTESARRRARKLLESSCPPWTTIQWNGDTPTYVHDVSIRSPTP